jgi:F420-non-reducing hydrogenase iron-sulfur subunit
MNATSDPVIVVLYCQNALAEGEFLGEGIHRGNGFQAQLVCLPCSSKIEVFHLVKHLELGADGIQVITCPPERCQFLLGNAKADKKVKYVRRLLDELKSGSNRVDIFRGRGLTAAQVFGLAETRAAVVREIEAVRTGNSAIAETRLSHAG